MHAGPIWASGATRRSVNGPASSPRRVSDEGEQPLESTTDSGGRPCQTRRMRFEHGDLVVDTSRFTIERDGAALHVEPQVFDVMSYLVAHRDRVVTKEELLDEVWGDRFVSESALSSRIKSARQALGDDGTRQEVIKTFHGRGYRWVAEIHVIDQDEPVPHEAGGADTTRSRRTPPPGLHTDTLGRDDILREVVDALADQRVVTLIGSPGIGKTRVALEALQRLDDERRDAAFVELHAASGRLDILHRVRQAIGLDDGSGTAIADPSGDDLEYWLLDRLAESDILLLLDNCEHIADHVAAFLRRLLPAAPSLTILATSRRPLWVDGERLVVVRPLDQPRDGSWAELASSSAGRLFLERSSAAGTAWSGTDDEAALIGEVCRRLDGVPLAIELAAARTRWMPLDRLVHDLADASDWSSTVQPVAASLRSSRDLLDEPSRAAFDALSVFVGTFSFDGALAVISAIRPHVDAVTVFEKLIDHSLIEVSDLALGRYRMLTPVRQFAASCEPRTEEVVPAVLSFFADLVERTWPTNTSTPGIAWNALDADMGDVLLLVEGAGTIDPAGCRRLTGSLGRWWWRADLTQRCVAICEALGEPDGDDPAAAARYLWTWSMCESLLWRQPSERARRAHQLAIETDQWSVAASALSLVVAGDQVWADIDAVEAAWDEIESLYRRADDIAGEAWARVRVLGHAQACAGRVADAIDSFRTAIALYEQIGDRIGVATAAVRFAREAIFSTYDPDLAEEALALLPDLVEDAHEPSPSLPYDLRAEAVWYRGRVAVARGDVDVGLDRHRAAVAICEAHAPRSNLTNTLRVQYAMALRRAGRYPEAAECLHEAAAKAVHVAGERPSHPLWVCEAIAGLLAELGRVEDSATLFGATEEGRRRLDDTRPFWDQLNYEHDVALIADAETASSARERGRELDADQAIEFAQACCAGLMTDA